MDKKNASIEFLLAEYERLRDVRAELIHTAQRRFEFYLTITSAITGAIIVIEQTQSSLQMPTYMIYLIALALLGYGLITFVNITYASCYHLHILRAFKVIQGFFISRDSDLSTYLYFNSPEPPENKYKFVKVLVRGMGGGSEKSLITLIDSTLFTFLLITFITNYLVRPTSDISIIIISIIVFICSCLLHVFYVTFMYRFLRNKDFR
jgi:hypothetical protein